MSLKKNEAHQNDIQDILEMFPENTPVPLSYGLITYD